MPEGDTIHKLAEAMRPHLQGQVITRIEARSRTNSATLGAQRATKVFAKGKHLFIELEPGLTVRSHLGMYGAWHRYAPNEPWRRPERQASLALWTESEVFVCFNAREVELLRRGGFRRHDALERLGPDLAETAVDVAPIPARARELTDPETPLCDVLLDQRVASGIGNVYKSEVLFLGRAHPAHPLACTTDAVLRRLYDTAHRLIRANLGGGRRVTRAAAPGPQLWVYARPGWPCLVCGTKILWARTGARLRSSYWCPRCQPLPPAGTKRPTAIVREE